MERANGSWGWAEGPATINFLDMIRKSFRISYSIPCEGSATRENPVRDFKSLAFKARFQDSGEYFKISRVLINTFIFK